MAILACQETLWLEISGRLDNHWLGVKIENIHVAITHFFA